MTRPDVVIIGAGLAGLACARRLVQARRSFLILEASDGIGGRVRTDLVDGFRLDRGFQIYLTAYPEGRRVLDYSRLKLCPFTRGAMIRKGGRFRRVADPRDGFWGGVKSFLGGVGTPADKLRLIRLKWALERRDLEYQWQRPEQLTLDFLRHFGGFSRGFIEDFFRPFLGGVFLERELTTSNRFFRFVFRMFADGPGAIPLDGMGAIPHQLAETIPAESLRLNTPVTTVERGVVRTASGEELNPRAVVVATDGRAASRLLGERVPEPTFNGTTTLYFTTPHPPIREPILILNAEGSGPINNLVNLSAASPNYAPLGESLFAASVIGVSNVSDEGLLKSVRTQLGSWFGGDAVSWRHLRTYRIPDALPSMKAGSLEPPQRPVRLSPGLYVCGDHRDNSSINGALESGFRTAQTLLEDLHTEAA